MYNGSELTHKKPAHTHNIQDDICNIVIISSYTINDIIIIVIHYSTHIQ